MECRLPDWVSMQIHANLRDAEMSHKAFTAPLKDDAHDYSTITMCYFGRFLGRSGDAEYDSTIITSHSIMDEASSSGDERKNIGITFLGSALHWKWMWPRQLIHLYNMGGPVPTK